MRRLWCLEAGGGLLVLWVRWLLGMDRGILVGICYILIERPEFGLSIGWPQILCKLKT